MWHFMSQVSDTHGNTYVRLLSFVQNGTICEGDAIIVLGDTGINFYLNKTDKIKKKILNDLGVYIYALKGNHEARPEDIPTMTTLYDETVHGEVYIEPDFDYIRYFKDGGEYRIDGHSVLCLGSAYSVDKWWRIQKAELNGLDPTNPKVTGWFSNEQLTEEERDEIFNKVKGKSYDLILSHTAPIAWEPIDLFLDSVDQTKVDKTMELWLDEIRQNIFWKVWVFGHFHQNRLERPFVEMYFTDLEALETIFSRWDIYRETGKLSYSLTKGPNFYKK